MYGGVFLPDTRARGVYNQVDVGERTQICFSPRWLMQSLVGRLGTALVCTVSTGLRDCQCDIHAACDVHLTDAPHYKIVTT